MSSLRACAVSITNTFTQNTVQGVTLKFGKCTVKMNSRYISEYEHLKYLPYNDCAPRVRRETQNVVKLCLKIISDSRIQYCLKTSMVMTRNAQNTAVYLTKLVCFSLG